MRVLSFDQWEFESPASEESLQMAISPMSHFSSLEKFVAACPRTGNFGRGNADGPLPLLKFGRASMIVNHLQEFASLNDFQAHEAEITVLSDEWNELEVVIKVPWKFIWYHWYTTA